MRVNRLGARYSQRTVVQPGALVGAAASLRGVWYAGRVRRVWGGRRAREYLRRHRPRQRYRLDPHKRNGACALLEYLVSTHAPRLPSGCSAWGRTACAASTRSTLPAYRLGAWYSQRTGGTPGTFGGRRREHCAACGVQAFTGGLVGIVNQGTGHVSVIGSTLTNITVRAHCLSTM
jgi:hypothetical protein